MAHHIDDAAAAAAAAIPTVLVVVTGASRGIGLSLVREYLKQGHPVLASARESTPELEQTGATVVTGVDISLPEGVAKLKAAVGDREIGVLINNAGMAIRDSLGALDYAGMLEQFQVNAMGPLRVTEALLENLVEGSKVAIITSRLGSIGDNYSSGPYYSYRMSKAALNAAGKSLAVGLKPCGVAVGLLHPGLVSTRMVDFKGEITPEQSASWLLERISELSLESSGVFRNSKGEYLPW